MAHGTQSLWSAAVADLFCIFLRQCAEWEGYRFKRDTLDQLARRFWHRTESSRHERSLYCGQGGPPIMRMEPVAMTKNLRSRFRFEARVPGQIHKEACSDRWAATCASTSMCWCMYTRYMHTYLDREGERYLIHCVAFIYVIYIYS